MNKNYEKLNLRRIKWNKREEWKNERNVEVIFRQQATR